MECDCQVYQLYTPLSFSSFSTIDDLVHLSCTSQPLYKLVRQFPVWNTFVAEMSQVAALSLEISSLNLSPFEIVQKLYHKHEIYKNGINPHTVKFLVPTALTCLKTMNPLVNVEKGAGDLQFVLYGEGANCLIRSYGLKRFSPKHRSIWDTKYFKEASPCCYITQDKSLTVRLSTQSKKFFVAKIDLKGFTNSITDAIFICFTKVSVPTAEMVGF